MKKLLFLGAGILFAGFAFAQAIPNGGFESWSNVTWNDVNGYQCSNDQNVSQFGAPGANVYQGTGYHGLKSVILSTVKSGQDTLVGYITNSIQNPLQGKGGIPYNQKPKGIRFYYSTAIVPGDTAGVIVIFKRSGSVIGTYLYPFTASIGTFTLLNNTFFPALSATPDTMIFAAVSSLHAIYDNNNMKDCYPGNLLVIDSVTFTGGVTQPASPFDGDFEHWTADTMYVPSGWYSEFPGVFQTTDSHAGSYATQLTTVIAAGNNNTQAGVISTGPFYNVGPNMGGYPYTETNDTLEFYYKYTPAIAGDSGVVYIELKKNGSPSGGNITELKPAASYTLQKVGFTTGTTPDSVIVAFASSKTSNPPNSYVGSVLKVDNVMFKSNPLGVLNLTDARMLKVYPNPVKNQFYINSDGYTGSVQRVDVYDMAGRLILSANYASGLNTTVTSFDLSNSSPGIYIVKVLTSTGVFYQKISKIQ